MQIQIGASDSSSTDVYYSTSSGEIPSPPHQSDDEVTCYSLATSRPKNPAGRRIFKETRHPVFRGVRKRKGNKWVCEMREPNKKNARIWLGTYPTPEMAARAHDVAALAFSGKSACLNFADSAWKLPIPTSSDAKVIQRVANEAAQMFRPEHQLVALVSVIDSISYEENNELYMDGEEVLDMPWLVDDMAQGLLLSPPPNYFEDGLDKWDNEETEAGQFLMWDY